MPVVRCSLSFHRIRVDELDVFAVGVRDGVYGNPTLFATPVIPTIDFQALIDTYLNTRGAYKQGGKAQKGPFRQAKDELMRGLDETANYVNSIAQGDENIITIAGYVPTKGVASTTPEPTQFTTTTLSRGISGVLFAECENQKGVDTYACIMTVAEPLPTDVSINAAGQLILGTNAAAPKTDDVPVLPDPSGATIDFNKSRKKEFEGLTPGVTYYFYFFGINASGVGPLSAGKSIVCW